jgi:hypothetical protein
MRSCVAKRQVIALGALLAAAAPAAADPIEPRVLTAPTAWLPCAGDTELMLGIDHRGDPAAIAVVGLGELAALELGSDSDVRAIAAPRAVGETAGPPSPIALGRAAFRIGARQGAWFAGMPAVVLGVRTAFAAAGHAVHAPSTSEAYLVASRDLGAVRIHAGAAVIAASVDGMRGSPALRPLVGLEIHPAMYPRSSLLGDIAWVPALAADRPGSPGWLLGVGVRYQVFPWAAIELAVRARQAEELGASTVMIRVDARWHQTTSQPQSPQAPH